MVCRQIDMFIVNNTCWMAKLSNGELIYQDDDRPEYEEKSAWIRLGQYIKLNNLSITGLGIRYKTNSLWLEDNKPGYFFSKVAGATWGDNSTFHFYKIGYLDGDTVKTFQYRIPELVLFDSNQKAASSCMIGTLITNGEKTN